MLAPPLLLLQGSCCVSTDVPLTSSPSSSGPSRCCTGQQVTRSWRGSCGAHAATGPGVRPLLLSVVTRPLSVCEADIFTGTASTAGMQHTTQGTGWKESCILGLWLLHKHAGYDDTHMLHAGKHVLSVATGRTRSGHCCCCGRAPATASVDPCSFLLHVQLDTALTRAIAHAAASGPVTAHAHTPDIDEHEVPAAAVGATTNRPSNGRNKDNSLGPAGSLLQP
jgi:hypothetical protein